MRIQLTKNVSGILYTTCGICYFYIYFEFLCSYNISFLMIDSFEGY